jgi:hypothetical protein
MFAILNFRSCATFRGQINHCINNDLCLTMNIVERCGCISQIFDCHGVFRFEINVCGKDDGQLLYPNRVTVCKVTGNIVITERSPTHQVRLYPAYAANYVCFAFSLEMGICFVHKLYRVLFIGRHRDKVAAVRMFIVILIT